VKLAPEGQPVSLVTGNSLAAQAGGLTEIDRDGSIG
jgi:hypothetical protein